MVWSILSIDQKLNEFKIPATLLLVCHSMFRDGEMPHVLLNQVYLAYLNYTWTQAYLVLLAPT